MEPSYTEDKNKINLLIGMTGSVAAIRLIDIIKGFTETNKFNLRIVLTEKAKYFTDTIVPNKDYKLLENQYQIKIYFEGDEFELYKENNNNILHISLRNWADSILLAPLSANSLAKIANGLCDNLLTSIIRAVKPETKVFFNLAMNTFMYEKPITYKQIDILKKEMGFIHIPSLVKKLKCGDVGIGGIADTKDLISIVIENSKKN